MIPIRDENPSRTTPYVVYILIALNVLFFAVDYLGTRPLTLYSGPRGEVSAPISGLWGYSMVPAQVLKGDPNLPIPVSVQTNLGRLTAQVPHRSPSPVLITILTSMFLHGGLLHIGGNMLYLWIFGNNIEDALGHVKFLLFYLFGGVVAALAHIASNPTSTVPTVGASGAIAAVLGAYLVLYPRRSIDCLIFLGYFVTTAAVPAVVVLGMWILIQLISATIGQGGGVAYWAHVGGFAAGAVGILLLGGRRLIDRRGRYRDTMAEWHER